MGFERHSETKRRASTHELEACNLYHYALCTGNMESLELDLNRVIVAAAAAIKQRLRIDRKPQLPNDQLSQAGPFMGYQAGSKCFTLVKE